jgi:predicted enzyme related to lactoylglutathione lyase
MEGTTVEFASIRIITDDLERLVGFYELVTGITATRRAPVFVELHTGAGTLTIGTAATVEMLGAAAPTSASNNSVLIEFLVDDVDVEFERLRGQLDDVILEPTTMPWGNRSTLFRDPDGNIINLFARPTASNA